jgi:hypothetical protein
MLLAIIDGDHDAEKREKSEDEKNLAGGNARGARIAGAAGGGAFIELDGAPKNEYERPPMPEELADTEALIPVEEQEHPDRDQNKARKD